GGGTPYSFYAARRISENQLLGLASVPGSGIAVLVKNDSIEQKHGSRNHEGSLYPCDKGQGKTVLALVRRARRRLFYNELFAQGANASSAALAALILLLLLGTEIVSWQFAIVIPVAAFAGAVYVAWRRLASPYATA